MARLGEAGGDKAPVYPLPPEVNAVAQEGRQLGRPLGGGKSHQKHPLPNKIVKGQINKPMLKKNIQQIPQIRLSPARGAVC
jgi:hypothetical protein